LYAILPLYPRGALVIRDLKLAKGVRIGMLGTSLTNIAWQQRGRNIEVSMPAHGTTGLPSDGAVTLEIEGVAVQKESAP